MTVQTNQTKFTEATIIETERKNVLKQIKTIEEYSKELERGDMNASLAAGLIEIRIRALKNHFTEYSNRIEKRVKVQ